LEERYIRDIEKIHRVGVKRAPGFSIIMKQFVGIMGSAGKEKQWHWAGTFITIGDHSLLAIKPEIQHLQSCKSIRSWQSIRKCVGIE
jgi:hypothetical protein